MDSAGKPACEGCGRRLSKCKGKLYKKPPGLICHLCYNDPERNSRPPSAAPPPARSHKRKDPPAGEPHSAPAALTAPPLLPSAPPASFTTHGASFRPSTRTSRATAASWLELARDSELARWEVKRGGYHQHDTALSLQCSFLDEKRVRLRHSAERIARDELSAFGVRATSLQLAAMKLLRTSKGEGLQEIHYDITEYARALNCFTVLIYLTDTESTAVPTLSMKELRPTFTQGEKRPSAAALKFLSRDKFQTRRVTAGEMLVLNCAVPHYGVANPDEQDRCVLFLLFSPSDCSPPDSEEQRYPHGVED